MLRLLVLVLPLALASLALSCGGGGGDGEATATPPAPTSTPAPASCAEPPEGTPAPRAANGFANGSFEAGKEPWISLSTEAWGKPFEVSGDQAVEGANSAVLNLRSEEGGRARVYGVVQEIAPQEFPEVISGYYCVTRWEKGTPDQYLQFVVIAFGADTLPPQFQGEADNYQVRYLLAGIALEPFNISNARYIFLTRDEPKVGEWVHFERNVRQDFIDVWGEAPKGYDTLRILFETRWDNRDSGDGPSAADVYYDALYAGPG